MKIIKGMATSRNYKPDTYGWMFTKFSKYTVKLGYKAKHLYADKGPRMIYYGPEIRPMLAFSWKLKCPSKLRHFVW